MLPTARRTRRLALVVAGIVASFAAPRLVRAQDVFGAEQISSPPKLVSPAAFRARGHTIARTPTLTNSWN